MGAKVDRNLKLNSGGRHLSWGTVQGGPTTYWWTSKMGEASSLTLNNKTSYAVDFTGASGTDVMLVTTGKAEGPSVKVGGKTLTFLFPTANTPPKVKQGKNAAIVARQKITLEDGNLVLSVTQR